MASGCSRGVVRVWGGSSVSSSTSGGTGATTTWRSDASCLAELKGHTGAVHALALLPWGLLGSGGGDGEVRLWSVAARACVAVLRAGAGALGGAVHALAALPNGRLASAGHEGVVCVWELQLA